MTAHGRGTPSQPRPSASTAAMAGAGPDAAAAEMLAEPTGVALLSQLKPLVTRAQMSEHLDECGEVRAMSPTVAQILKMTGSAQCSIEQVARVIKQDHAIALKILKLANSTVYTRGEPVESVHKAVMRIGLTQIRQSVLNISIVEHFSDEGSGGLAGLGFWEHSIACGLIAAELTRGLGGKEDQVESAFTMGLLHDVGRLVYAERLGETYARVRQVAQDLRLPLEQVETRLLLLNHADAMERILQAWRFPKHLACPIASHHLSMGNLRHLAPSLMKQAATLALGNRLAHALVLGESANETIYALGEFVRGLDVPAEVLRQIEERVPEATRDMRLVMLSHSSETPVPSLRQRVRTRLGSLRPLFVSAEPERDAYRMLLDRLRAEEEGPPNVGVVHLADVGERVALTAQYQQAEAKAQSPPLPLVVLSPKGDLRLEESTMAARRFSLLPTPVTVGRLVEAARVLVGKDDGRTDKTA